MVHECRLLFCFISPFALQGFCKKGQCTIRFGMGEEYAFLLENNRRASKNCVLFGGLFLGKKTNEN